MPCCNHHIYSQKSKKIKSKMIEINKLKRLAKPEQISITEHARVRMVERNITVEDIVNCVSGGEIIKQYEEDNPFPSCLILGDTKKRAPLHIVVSCDDEYIYLITAYYPQTDLWQADYKTRKE